MRGVMSWTIFEVDEMAVSIAVFGMVEVVVFYRSY